MNSFREARCPLGHNFTWLTGTSFVCPTCKQAMRPGTIGGLTSREQEVVAIIGKGLTNRQIAEKLVIEECTVENHVHRIMRKLGFTTRIQIARYAWEQGIEPEP